MRYYKIPKPFKPFFNSVYIHNDSVFPSSTALDYHKHIQSVYIIQIYLYNFFLSFLFYTLAERTRNSNYMTTKQKLSLSKTESEVAGGSEIALTRLAEEHFAGKIKYDSGIQEWRLYEDGVWSLDLHKRFRKMLEDFLHETVRAISRQIKKSLDMETEPDEKDKLSKIHKKTIRLLDKIRTVQGVTTIQKNLATYTTCDPGDFDNTVHKVCLLNGVFSFEDYKLYPHDPEEMFTKRVNIGFDREARCPKWKEFISLIFRGNENVIRYVQKIFGYCLTGHNSLQSLFFLYGDGANGKSMVINVLKALLGDQDSGYFFQFKADQLLGRQKHHDSTKQYALASLAGKRVIVGSEVPSDMIFDTAMIKDITGGDTVTARNPAGRFFNFTPNFKVLLYGNHQPRLKETDTGIRRRIKLIKFDYSFETEGKHLKRDSEEVFAEFVAELPGIFNWAVKGFDLYKKEKLEEPEEISQYTKQYIDDQDQVLNFLAEECEISQDLEISAKTLWDKYTEWCDGSGLRRSVTRREFYVDVEKQGIPSKIGGTGKQKLFMGIGMKPGTPF